MSNENDKKPVAPPTPPPEQKPVGDSPAANLVKDLAGKINEGKAEEKSIRTDYSLKDLAKENERRKEDVTATTTMGGTTAANVANAAGIMPASTVADMATGGFMGFLMALRDDPPQKQLKRNEEGELVEEEDNIDGQPGYNNLPENNPLAEAQENARKASAENMGATPEQQQTNSPETSGEVTTHHVEIDPKTRALHTKLEQAQAAIKAERDRMMGMPQFEPPSGPSHSSSKRDDD